MAPPPPPSPPALKPHVAIFPFMAQGHTLPLIDLSKALSSRGLRVTIVTTPSNASAILACVSGHHRLNISLAELRFPATAVGGCENTSDLPSLELHPAFLHATASLREPFEALLRRMRDSGDLPRFVVSDFFLGFTLGVCQAFGVPRLVFHGMGVLSMSVCKASWVHKPHLDESLGVSDPVDFPGLKLPYSLTLSDLPADVNSSSDTENPVTRFLEEIVEAELKSWGVLANSFVEVEMGSVSFLESLYREGARVWCVGPLSLYDNGGFDDGDSPPSDHDGSGVMRWLDELRPGSTLYVSFGSQCDVSEAQLDEVAHGLVESGEHFVWVVRSKTWSPPNDIKERINDKGLIVSGWVDQRRILGHGSVGGFLSHCGWNSVLESLSVGVPILAWPMFAEQALNAKLVVDGLGAGVGVIRKPNSDGVVSRGAICKGVRELMGEKGRAVKERAEALGCVAKRAVNEGGSSRRNLDELLQKLCEKSTRMRSSTLNR